MRGYTGDSGACVPVLDRPHRCWPLNGRCACVDRGGMRALQGGGGLESGGIMAGAVGSLAWTWPGMRNAEAGP